MSIFSRRPLVSVIMPSYNHEAFVGEAIGSALNQTVQDIEVIVVDDGSSDNTSQKIMNISDPRVRFTGLARNREIHARNLALKMAQGMYIAFLNSDDVWESTKLESQLADFHQKPELGASFTRVAMITPDGKISTTTWAEGAFCSDSKTSAEWLRFFYESGNDLCISSAVVPRKILDKVGLFDESLVQLADLDMWIRIAAVSDLWVNEQILTKMRINGKKNLSAPSPKLLRRSAIELLEVMNNYRDINLAEAFFDLIPNTDMSKVNQLASLARYSWSKSPTHVLFGTRLFGDLIKNPDNRQEIIAHFGIDILHDFLDQRSQLEVVKREG